MPSACHYRQHNHRSASKQRDVVTPPVFEMDGRMSLKDFFITFEKYFHKKFDGDEHDKTQELAKFLTGPLLEVYKIKGGRRLKYKSMKETLLTFYRDQKVGGKSYWRQQLKDAMPHSGEGLDVYAIRLVELAELAYPKSPVECARSLRQQFLVSIPSSISTKILDAERAQCATRSSGRHLSFKHISCLAKKLQVEKTSKSIMWTASKDSPTAPQHSSRLDTNPRQSQDLRQQHQHAPYSHRELLQSSERFTPRDGNSTQQPCNFQAPQRRHQSTSRTRTFTPGNSPICGHCGGLNHTSSECWRASKSCLICGGGHHLEQCSRFDPSRLSRSQQRVHERHLN
jgi:hypothetical protein